MNLVSDSLNLVIDGLNLVIGYLNLVIGGLNLVSDSLSLVLHLSVQLRKYFKNKYFQGKTLRGGNRMEIRVISSRGEISKLNPSERIFHMAFRPSNRDILGLVEACPKIEVIQLPKSYRRTISKSIEMFLEMKRIQLIEGEIGGHRKDISDYYSIPSSVIEKIREMKVERKSAEAIEKEVSRRTRLDPEMVAYIMTKEAPA